jgi:SAM-dependent methyltransferase
MTGATSGERLGKFWFGRGWKRRWEAEVARRARGLNLQVDEWYAFHTNPLFEPANAMRYTAGRYRALFDEMARLKPKTVLEIGCAHGLATWLMKDFAETVVGVDIIGSRISLGRHMFPEVELVAADFAQYLAGLNGKRFDLMVCSHGPVKLPERVFDYCDRYVWIGYRPLNLRETLTGAHKLPGRQLSHSTTIMGKGESGRSARYWGHYFTRDYLMSARHALANGYSLPL